MNPEFWIGTVIIGGGSLLVQIYNSQQKIKQLSKENEKLKEITVTVNVNVGQVVGSNAFTTLPEDTKAKLLKIQASTSGTPVITKHET